jgi:fatty-acid desaturase
MRIGQLLRSPFMLMFVSCYVIAWCFVSGWRPLTTAIALFLIPAVAAFSVAYLAWEAWYRATGHETFQSPWGLPIVFAFIAALTVAVRVVFG